MKLIYSCFIVLFLFVSCKKEINYGTIEFFYNYVDDATVNDFILYTQKGSSIYFYNDNILEITDFQNSKYYNYIIDNKSTIPNLNLGNINKKQLIDFAQKQIGFKPFVENLDGYDERNNISDTILDNVSLKRFELNTDSEFSVFYISENLNLPVSYNKLIEKDYKGTIVRIDCFSKKTKEFVTYKIIYKKELPNDIYKLLK